MSSADISSAEPLSRQQFLSRSPSHIHLYPWQKQRIVDFLRSSPFGSFGGERDDDHVVNYIIERAWPCLSSFETDEEVDKATAVVMSWVNRMDVNRSFQAGYDDWSHQSFPDPERYKELDWYKDLKGESLTKMLKLSEDIDIHADDIYPPPLPGSFLPTLHKVEIEEGDSLPPRTLVLVDEIEDVYWCWIILDVKSSMSRQRGAKRVLVPTWAVASPVSKAETANSRLRAGGKGRVVRDWKGEIQAHESVRIIDVGASWCWIETQTEKLVCAPSFCFVSVVAGGPSGDHVPSTSAAATLRRQRPKKPLLLLDQGSMPQAGNSKPFHATADKTPAPRGAPSYLLPSIGSKTTVLHDYRDPEDVDLVLTAGETVRLLKVVNFWSYVESDEVGSILWVPHWVVAKLK